MTLSRTYYQKSLEHVMGPPPLTMVRSRSAQVSETFNYSIWLWILRVVGGVTTSQRCTTNTNCSFRRTLSFLEDVTVIFYHENITQNSKHVFNKLFTK